MNEERWFSRVGARNDEAPASSELGQSMADITFTFLSTPPASEIDGLR